MKIIQVLITLTIGLTVISCERHNTNPTYPFEAVVLGPNMDCGLFQIKFTYNVEEVIKIVGSSLQNVYIAENLPDELKVEGINIVLDIRKPKYPELGACTAMGPSYTWLHVIIAKSE
jgi:hypothetical protein